MAARPRQKSNLDLPPNLYRADNAGFRYRRPDNGTWHGMGSDKAKAVAAAKKLNSLLVAAPLDLVATVMGEIPTFGKFSAHYQNEVLPTRNLAPKTLKQYAMRIKQANGWWEKITIDSITLKMVSDKLDTLTDISSNEMRNKLIDIFAHAIAKGLCPDNPVVLTLPKKTKKSRKRLTLDGLTAIRSICEPWLQNAIDLALLTTQRRSDILKLKWKDIRDGWMYIAQEKTTESSDDEFEELTGAGYIRIKIDSEIQAVLDRCKSDNILSPFVVHRRPKRIDPRFNKDREHWTQIDLNYLTREFSRARDKVNPYPNLTSKQQPSFHEIRALSIHLYKQMGRDPQALAGHANPEMTEVYAVGHGNIVWNDVEVGLKLPFQK
jgi:integrase